MRRWAYWVCTLLLLATVLNYMDRQALAVIAKRIKGEFDLSAEQYGWVETGFGLAFALGQMLLGIVADRANLRWFYPLILLLWSMMGFATGMVCGFAGLLLCRSLLGFFEGGNWPCGLRIVQQLLSPAERTLGNGLLQSGGAIGALLTPVVLAQFLTDAPGSWRPAFQVIGALGAVWAVLWLVSVDRRSLEPSASLVEKVGNANSAPEPSFRQVLGSRRFVVVLVVAVSVNLCWHMLRVWLPLFLQEGRDFTEAEMLHFQFWYYVAADVGAWVAGGGVLWLHARGGLPLHAARNRVYLLCCLLTGLTTVAAVLPAGARLWAVLLAVGFGSLGLFPCFYALSQALSIRHQGKVIGILGTSAWLALSALHPLFGRYIDQTGAYDLGLAVVGWAPMVSFVALWLFWDRPADRPV